MLKQEEDRLFLKSLQQAEALEEFLKRLANRNNAKPGGAFFSCDRSAILLKNRSTAKRSLKFYFKLPITHGVEAGEKAWDFSNKLQVAFALPIGDGLVVDLDFMAADCEEIAQEFWGKVISGGLACFK